MTAPSPGSGVLGLLRRIGRRAGASASVSMVEELFGPTRHRARVEMERQRLASRPVPAPTDPPEPDEEGPGRFAGRFVIRRR